MVFKIEFQISKRYLYWGPRVTGLKWAAEIGFEYGDDMAETRPKLRALI